MNLRNRSMALVVKEKKILLIKEYIGNKEILILPGGGIEHGETPEEASIRELKEETGLLGKINRHLNILHRKTSEKDKAYMWSYGITDVKGFEL